MTETQVSPTKQSAVTRSQEMSQTSFPYLLSGVYSVEGQQPEVHSQKNWSIELLLQFYLL